MFPLELSLNSSRSITLALVFFSVVIAVGVWFTSAPIWFCGSVSALAMIETGRQILEHGIRTLDKSVVALRWLDVFEWRVEFKNSAPYVCQEMRVEFMSAFIITLSVPGRWNLRKKIWIAKDSVGEEGFRTLTVGLKMLDEARKVG